MTRFSILPERSELSAEAKSSVHPIHGEARRLSGWIEAVVTDGQVDVDQPAGAYIELATDALKADNALANKEIQRRIGGRRYPTINAEIKKITGPTDGRYGVHGDLSLHGITKEVAGQATVAVQADGALAVEGELTMDMRDFGLEPPKLLGLRVYPDVAVRLRVFAAPDN